MYGDSVAEQKILQESDSHEIRKLGKIVQGYKTNKTLWLQNGPSVVFKANMAKFSRHPNLRAILLATQGTFLAESTPDDFWGIGVSEKSDKEDPKKWVGKNVAGRILSDVRREILKVFQAQSGEADGVREAPRDNHNGTTADAEKKPVLIGDSHVCRVGKLPEVSVFECVGFPGATIETITDRVFKRGKNVPKRMTICAGINNLSKGQWPEYVSATFGPLLQTLRARNVEVTVIGIPLINHYGRNQVIKFTNKSIMTVCDIFGAKFVSSSPIFHVDGKFRSLGDYHLTHDGYEKLAELVKSTCPNEWWDC
jgi:ribA/ribD-fused uncharacterized protein